MIATERLFAAAEATWPPARRDRLGPWTLRDGQGGGSRVSAATAEAPIDDGDIGALIAAQRAQGQRPLVMVRPGDETVDAQLARQGFAVMDPVVALAAPVRQLADLGRGPLGLVAAWPPLAIQAEIWAAAGIGPARRAVMQRVSGPRTALLGRIADRPAAVAFVACDGELALLHALEVAPQDRRQGLGRHLLSGAARWALQQGASHLALLVTRANAPARALYASAGMSAVAEYHYRHLG